MSSGVVNQTLGELAVVFYPGNYTDKMKFAIFLKQNLVIGVTSGDISESINPSIEIDGNYVVAYVNINSLFIDTYAITICSQKSSMIYKVQIGVVNIDDIQTILFDGKLSFPSSDQPCTTTKTCSTIYFSDNKKFKKIN